MDNKIRPGDRVFNIQNPTETAEVITVDRNLIGPDWMFIMFDDGVCADVRIKDWNKL